MFKITITTFIYFHPHGPTMTYPIHLTYCINVYNCIQDNTWYQKSLIVLVSLAMTWLSEKMLISTRCICGFMPKLHKKSWMVSIAEFSFNPWPIKAQISNVQFVHIYYTYRAAGTYEDIRTGPHHVFRIQLTLSQPGGQIMPTTVLQSSPC